MEIFQSRVTGSFSISGSLILPTITREDAYSGSIVVVNPTTGIIYYTTASSGTNVISVTGSTLYSTNPTAGPSFNTTNSIFLGNSAGYQAYNASYSNFLGFYAGYEATNASQSNFIGTSAGLQASGSNNSNFLGYRAGYQATNAFRSNFLGPAAGNGAINANYSNFLGDQAGLAATDANNSNFLGTNAGQSATSASNSNFLGAGAGYQAANANDSNFLGANVGNSATNAYFSNFLGVNAGNSATNANDSNFLGTSAGSQATSASFSTLLGYRVGYNTAGGALGIKSNNIIIGTNITLPDGTKDSINLGGIIFATGSYATTAGNPFSGSAGGRVGINKVSPDYTLDVNASGSVGARIYSGSLAVGNITASATVGRIDASNDIVAYSTSDNRLKTNFVPIQNAIPKITQISGYEFDWIPNQEIHGFEGHDVGVIAQEIEKILPEVVTTRDNGYKAVKYEKIVPLLIEAIKEQQQQIEELKLRLDVLTK